MISMFNDDAMIRHYKGIHYSSFIQKTTYFWQIRFYFTDKLTRHATPAISCVLREGKKGKKITISQGGETNHS